MTQEIINVADKRKEIAELRARADDIETALNLLVGPSIQHMVAPVVREKALPKAPPTTTPRRGKMPGSMSEKWKKILAEAHRTDGGRFTPDIIIKIVFHRANRTMHRAEVKRQIQPYLAAGHIRHLGQGADGDLYELTNKGLEKIGFIQEQEGPAELSEGPSVGDVAERLNAPDSKSGGGVPDSPPPVGSNPTVSVPISPGNLWDRPQ